MLRDAPQDNEQILRELLSVTEDTVAAARIDHRSALDPLLDRRGKLLAVFWGFPPDQPLPLFDDSRVGSTPPSLSGSEKRLLKRVISLDNKVLKYLNANRERLLNEFHSLRRGERAISGLRDLLRDGRTGGKRVDMRG